MNDKDLITLLDSLKSNDKKYFWCQLKSLIHSSYLPEVKHGEERPFEEADFIDHKRVVYSNISTLALVFKELNVITNHDSSCEVEIMQDIILLCGEHMKLKLWSSIEISELAQILLSGLAQFLKFESFTKLLFGINDLPRALLLKLRPKLMKDTWKSYPAAISCYCWLLFEIKSPDMSDYLDIILPTTLIVLDDHIFDNKIIGMECIEHILNNITRTEVNRYGRGDLLYKAVEPMLYFREPKLMPSLFPCLIALLNKTETDPSGLNLKWSRFDDVFNIWLPGMEMEQKFASRIVYIECLTPFLKAAGLISVRWSRKILSILTEYSMEKNTCEKSLEALLAFIEVGWPRMHCHCDSIFIILMKVAMDLCDLEDAVESSNIKPLLRKCFHKLELAAPDQVNKLKVEVLDNNCMLLDGESVLANGALESPASSRNLLSYSYSNSLEQLSCLFEPFKNLAL